MVTAAPLAHEPLLHRSEPGRRVHGTIRDVHQMCRSLNRESWRRPAYALSPVECLGQALQSSEDRVSGQPAALGSCGIGLLPHRLQAGQKGEMCSDVQSKGEASRSDREMLRSQPDLSGQIGEWNSEPYAAGAWPVSRYRPMRSAEWTVFVPRQ